MESKFRTSAVRPTAVPLSLGANTAAGRECALMVRQIPRANALSVSGGAERRKRSSYATCMRLASTAFGDPNEEWL